MAIAYDSFFNSADSLDANDITVACTPVGTPRGLIAYALQATTNTDNIVGMTYGGVAMSEVSGSPLLKASVEQMGVHCFFLGASIPTGAQNLVVDRSAATSMIVGIILLTAAGDTEVVDTDTIQSDAVANPSGTLALASRTCFCAIGFTTGAGAVGAGYDPSAGWTLRVEQDHGSGCSGIYTYDTIASADVAAGWTQASEDANSIAIAVAEISSGGAVMVGTSRRRRNT